MNLVLLSGRLTRDPEIKSTPGGTSVTEFGIAVNKRWTDSTGAKKESVYFGECMCWGARGEAFAKFHKKGGLCLVRGELATDSWDDKETGVKKSKTRIRVEDWDFVDGGSRDQATQPSQQQPRQRDYAMDKDKRQMPAQHQQAADAEEASNSLPF